MRPGQRNRAVGKEAFAMRQYEMTLVAISEKRVKISAESAEAAAQMVEKIYSETNLLDFSNRDVTDVSVLARAIDIEK